jgi:hypothetical protein
MRAQIPMQCAVVPGSNTTSGTSLGSVVPNPDPEPVVFDCLNVQNVRVNVHFLQHDDGTGNFGALDDGHPVNPNTATTGYDYAQSLIYACNGHMDQSPVLNLAPGSSLTPIPKRIRWVLDGVYFDRSTFYRDGAAANGSPSHDYAPLCIRADSVINIFLVEEINSPYNTNGQLMALRGLRGYVFSGNQANCNTNAAPNQMWAVVASPWTNYIIGNMAPWQIASTVNHELCHLLGLNHPHQSSAYSWGECADAPQHPNFPNIVQCWNLNDPSGPYCNAQSLVSNNLMDYNAFQSALSPCQIDIMQGNLNSCLKSRYVFKCSDCIPVTATFDLPSTTACLPAPVWFDSRAAANYHWYKLEIDQVNASGVLIANTHYESTIYGTPLGRTRLDAVYAFAPSSNYQVKWTTHSYCGTAAVRVRTMSTPRCISNPVQPRNATKPLSFR